MRKLSTIELGRLTPQEALHAERLPVVVVLDNIRSAMNVGSIFRTADAFRAVSIFICGVTATPPHREILKTALGATESVNWEYFQHTTDAINFLNENGFTVIAIEQTDNSVLLNTLEIHVSQKYAVVLGNEVSGIEDIALKMCDQVVEIPQWGAKHSLNVSVCAGIVLWDFAKRYLK